MGLKERITSLEEEIRKRPEPAINPLITDKEGRDNFQAIKGIGPVFLKRLHEAGVHTFEHLSQLTPGEMEEILGTLFKRFFSKENTILAQAKEFARQKAQNR
jgi:predicted flap endonuclease-1-like 5' DNA nuclease